MLWQWAGIRPKRSPLRLEAEVMTFSNGKLQVNHICTVLHRLRYLMKGTIFAGAISLRPALVTMRLIARKIVVCLMCWSMFAKFTRRPAHQLF